MGGRFFRPTPIRLRAGRAWVEDFTDFYAVAAKNPLGAFLGKVANADGPLRAAFGVPDGTRGKLVVSQTGLFDNPGEGKGVADGFPAETVRVFKVGK